MQLIKALVLASSLLAPAAFADETLPLEVTVASAEGLVDGGVTVQFRTIQIHSSMCHLRTTAITVREPQSSQLIGIPTPAIGAVELTASANPMGICLTAFGPHSGSITLPVGPSLPSIHNGYYALKINGQDYGVLHLGSSGAQLLDWSEIPQ